MAKFEDDIDWKEFRARLWQALVMQCAVLVVLSGLQLWRWWDARGAKIKE